MNKKKILRPLKHDAVKLLIVHCSATRCDRDFSVDSLISTGEARFGQPSYHYYVKRNGDIIPILPESVQGVHARHYNYCSIGICYEGGLTPNGVSDDTRTEAQKHSLYELLVELREEYPDARIIGHCELPHVAKPCPCFTPSTEYAFIQPPSTE